MSERASESFAILGTIDPVDTGLGTLKFDVIDTKLYDSVVFIVQTGTISSCGKFILTVYDGAANSTAGCTSSVGATTHTATTGDIDFQMVFDFDCEDHSAAANHYVYCNVITSGAFAAGVLVSGVALGFKTRYAPAFDNDLASVKMIKNST